MLGSWLFNGCWLLGATTLFAACAANPAKGNPDKNAPQAISDPLWLIKDSGRYPEDGVVAYWGVGSAKALKNKALQRDVATKRARSAIYKLIEDEVTLGYLAPMCPRTPRGPESPGHPDCDRPLARILLEAVYRNKLEPELVGTWTRHSDGRFFVRTKLDVASVVTLASKTPDLPANLAHYLKKNAFSDEKRDRTAGQPPEDALSGSQPLPWILKGSGRYVEDGVNAFWGVGSMIKMADKAMQHDRAKRRAHIDALKPLKAHLSFATNHGFCESEPGDDAGPGCRNEDIAQLVRKLSAVPVASWIDPKDSTLYVRVKIEIEAILATIDEHPAELKTMRRHFE